MRLFADLHIHSCLSPCGHEDMTPNNIVNMAYIKGLQAIAVADHNSAKNLPAVEKVAKERGILLLPAMEVTTQEDVHILTYFPSVDLTMEASEWLREKLLPIPNNLEIWGPQQIRNEGDEIIGEEDRMLAQASELTIAKLADSVRAMGGVCVPAHINRPANGILNMLGMMPLDVRFPTVEVRANYAPPGIDLSPYLVLRASDAHQLEDIAEPDFSLKIPESTISALFDEIKAGLRE